MSDNDKINALLKKLNNIGIKTEAKVRYKIELTVDISAVDHMRMMHVLETVSGAIGSLCAENGMETAISISSDPLGDVDPREVN